MTTAIGSVTPPVGMGTYQSWLVAWKEWARTRKRGKMAQFIVDKLEDNKQARWLSITEGKFELTEWHDIAKEWFKEKPRTSDQVDAPCMLRKGLPRAFPGLEEVKGESIKEGTQYRSRVFIAPPELVHEVMMYIQNGRGMHGHMGMPPAFNPPGTSMPYHQYSPAPQMAHYSTAMTNSHQVQVNSPPQVMSNGVGPSSQMYGSVYNTPENHQIKIEGDNFMVDSPSAPSDSQSPYYVVSQPAPYISTSQPSVDGLDQGLADAIVTNHHSPGSTVYSDPPDSASPFQQPVDVLQLPPGMGQIGQGMGQTMGQETGWISPGSHSQNNSPRYSPDPTEMTGGVGYPVNSMGMVMNPQPPSAGPMSAPVSSPPMQQTMSTES